MDLDKLNSIAIKAARSAGIVIMKYMNEEVAVLTKEAGDSYASQVVTAVDKECEIEILSHLNPTCNEFNIAILSEETDDDGGRFVEDYFWCIDPMDGTLAFINKNPGFSVSIALVSKDGTPYIGVVYDPSTDTIYHAIKGKGAFKNGKVWTIINTNSYLTFVTDRQLKDTPQSDKIEKLIDGKADQLNINTVKEMAGAGSVLNAIFVLEHGPAIMLKHPKAELGGGSTWDYAATSCIYHELDIPATNFMGGKLDLNKKENTFMNHQGVLYSNLK